MRGLAYVVIAVVPLCAVATILLALRRGRPHPFAAWTTAQVQDRLGALEASGPVGGPAATERRQLRDELFRRGRLH